ALTSINERILLLFHLSYPSLEHARHTYPRIEDFLFVGICPPVLEGCPCKIIDDVDLFRHALHPCIVIRVLRIILYIMQVGVFGSVLPAGQYIYMIMFLHQSFSQFSPDEAGTACNQYVHIKTPPLTYSITPMITR